MAIGTVTFIFGCFMVWGAWSGLWMRLYGFNQVANNAALGVGAAIALYGIGQVLFYGDWKKDDDDKNGGSGGAGGKGRRIVRVKKL